jgi:hypothetical protein
VSTRSHLLFLRLLTMWHWCVPASELRQPHCQALARSRVGFIVLAVLHGDEVCAYALLGLLVMPSCYGVRAAALSHLRHLARREIHGRDHAPELRTQDACFVQMSHLRFIYETTPGCVASVLGFSGRAGIQRRKIARHDARHSTAPNHPEVPCGPYCMGG